MKRIALLLALLLLLPLAPVEGAGRRYIKKLRTDDLLVKLEGAIKHMDRNATAGVGTSASPWTGWESACTEGDVCYFPAGWYSTATGLTVTIAAQNVPAETMIIGDGSEASIIQVTADATALTVNGSGNSPDLVEGIIIRDLGFQSSVDLTVPLVQLEEFETQWAIRDVHLRNPTAGINIAKGLYLLNCQMGMVDNLLVRAYSANNDSDFDVGVHIYSDDGIQRGNTQFVGGQIANAQTGIQITSTGGLLNNISFLGMKIVNSVAGTPADVDGSIGFDLTGIADGASLINVHVERYEQCVKANGVDNLVITNGIFSNCFNDANTDGAAIELLGASEGTVILAPRFNFFYDGLVIPAAAVQAVYYKRGRINDKVAAGTEVLNNSTSEDALFFADGGSIGLNIVPAAGVEFYSYTATGNNDMQLERGDGAAIRIQAQAAAGVMGTSDNNPLSLTSNDVARVEIDASRVLINPAELCFEGATADDFENCFTATDPTTPDKTWTMPDVTGTVALIGGGASPAATCTVGEIFIDTDETVDTNCTTTADNSLCLCTATDTWTALENN